jgi:hypothetical protein
MAPSGSLVTLRFRDGTGNVTDPKLRTLVRVQLPPHPVPGCDAATGLMPPAVVVVVVGSNVEVVLPPVEKLVVGTVVDTLFEGVIETS